MRIALLVCDHVNEEYRAEFGDYADMFARLFPTYHFTCYEVMSEEFPTELETYDAFMATGSRHSVYEDLAWIKSTLQFIQLLNKKKKCFVGYCFGHQLIGQALGGRVEKSPNGWCVGVHTFEPLGMNLLMMCQDQIVALPPDTKVLGGNEKCPHGIIQVEDQMLGIQAHPEFSKGYDRMLMETRIDRMGVETVGMGIASLEKSLDTERVRDYIHNFIKNANQ